MQVLYLATPNMTLGRPTEYGSQTLESARGYLSTGWQSEEEVLPTVAGLAHWLGISRDTVYEWVKHEDKRAFSDIVEYILGKQEMTLIAKGLKGEFNASITKLMLTKHGYTDKQDVTTGGKELPTPIIPLNAIQRDDSTT